MKQEVVKIADKSGNVNKGEFVRFCMEKTKLGKAEDKKAAAAKEKKETPRGGSSSAHKSTSIKRATVDEKDIDRIEKAFRKFDTDNDGYIDRTEFEQIASQLSQEQADRIWEACDADKSGRISLQEFRAFSDKKKAQ